MTHINAPRRLPPAALKESQIAAGAAILTKFDSYPVEFTPLAEINGQDGWLAEFPDLPGCYGYGVDRAAAFANGREAFELWVKDNLKHGRDIPEPNSSKRPSGNFRIRVPAFIYDELTQCAGLANTSLNGLVSGFLWAGIASLEKVASGYLPSAFKSRDNRSSAKSGAHPKDGGGEWIQRIEKPLHYKLQYHSVDQGVSMNTLIVSIICYELARQKVVLVEERRAA